MIGALAKKYDDMRAAQALSTEEARAQMAESYKKIHGVVPEFLQPKEGGDTPTSLTESLREHFEASGRGQDFEWGSNSLAGDIAGDILLSGLPGPKGGAGLTISRQNTGLSKKAFDTVRNLISHPDDLNKTAAQFIKDRGGKAGNVNEVATYLQGMPLKDIANLAAKKDKEAVKALKIIKRASTYGQRY